MVEPEMMPLTTPASTVAERGSLWGFEPRGLDGEAIASLKESEENFLVSSRPSIAIHGIIWVLKSL